MCPVPRPLMLLATLSPQATSSVPSLCSTHAFSLCSGLAVDYFDGGKDLVSILHREVKECSQREGEKGSCYQKTGPQGQSRVSPSSPACVSSVSDSTEQGSTNLISQIQLMHKVQRSVPAWHLEEKQPAVAKLPSPAPRPATAQCILIPT